MACIKCSRTAKIDLKHLGGSLCPSCFAEVIEKRVRKSLRDNKWLKPADKILYIDDGTLQSKVGIYLIKAIFQNQPFNIDFKKGTIKSADKLSKGYNKVLIPWNLDDEIEQYLDALFNAKKVPKTKHIKLLINISHEEISYFAKIKKIKGRQKTKSKLGKMLDSLEKRYPGSKFGLLRSISP
ncbi:hypothetical protein KY338_00680 [Candidatus Woesearchaeota archaeon]|nr:hypothetical protein [Candidatus Woesearchaeota archaeon]MBW3005165.1 hypothetical protein [Candidatus Woesearchaeota archaeon]